MQSVLDVPVGGPLSPNALAKRAAAATATAAAAASAPAAAAKNDTRTPPAGYKPPAPDSGFPVWTALVGVAAVAIGAYLYWQQQQQQ
jgi:hypothetical protein